MSNAVKIETGTDGRIVLIEPEQRKGLDRRVFRYVNGSALEWAHFADWRQHNVRARWYGYASKELPATMTAA